MAYWRSVCRLGLDLFSFLLLARHLFITLAHVAADTDRCPSRSVSRSINCRILLGCSSKLTLDPFDQGGTQIDILQGVLSKCSTSFSWHQIVFVFVLKELNNRANIFLTDLLQMATAFSVVIEESLVKEGVCCQVPSLAECKLTGEYNHAECNIRREYATSAKVKTRY
jgi:hypothetical protein